MDRERPTGRLRAFGQSSAGLFGLVLGGLFLTLLGGGCAEMVSEHALESDDLAEQLVSITLAVAGALGAAALAATAFASIAQVVSAGYRVLLSSAPAQRSSLPLAAVGMGAMAVSVALGGWRLSAGYRGGDPGWVMQGTVIAAFGTLVGLMVVAPYLALALRGSGGRSKRDRAKPDRSAQTDGQSAGSEYLFALFAVVGIIASYGVVEYVHIGRAQAGAGPLPAGDFIDGRLRHDGFQGYPSSAELTLPPGLDGPHSIVFIEVSPCAMKLFAGDDEVKVTRIPAKKDADGDTLEYARLSFDADEDDRYRLVLTPPGDDHCHYGVRLRRDPGQEQDR